MLILDRSRGSALAPLVFLGSLALAIPAAAQGAGGVGGSGMAHGEARITARSAVRLAIEGLPGIGGSRITALGQRVGARMTGLRHCYEQTVAEHPATEGSLRMRLALEEGDSGPEVSVAEDQVHQASLLSCVESELSQIDASSLDRPSRVIVALTFHNTAAAGAERAASRAAEAQQVEVTTDADGLPFSEAHTPDGHIQFTVRGQAPGAGPAVIWAHRNLLTALPGLMDCRRRASRRGRSPAGQVDVLLALRRGRAPHPRVRRSTVRDERAGRCVGRVLGRSSTHAETSARLRVEIRFGAQ